MEGFTGLEQAQRESPGPATPNKPNGSSPVPIRSRVASNSLTPAPPHRVLSPGPSGAGDSSPVDAESSPQWSSAVGRATTGKSGRVIERLQGENDRLKRDLKFEILRREEEQKKGEAARGQMEGLRITNGNLAQIAEGDKASLARKDRRNEDLKIDLESERARRTEAEAQLKAVQKDWETLEGELRAAARESAEAERKALAQYETLSMGWKHLEEGFRTKVEALRKDVTKMAKDGVEDGAKVQRLTLISEQQQKEIERLHVAKKAVDRGFEKYKSEADEGTRAIRESALQREVEHDQVMDDALSLLNSMRHVINVKENLRPED
ncbi:MAG: hypothetical protein M4579_003975 [Chaenotheca gracillima]|nr:MAG: hypothetical protein M4579_003975 [Chaenotheca gracillima]